MIKAEVIDSIRRQLFEFYTRDYVDLAKYYHSMRTYIPDQYDFVYSFFSALRKFKNANPIIVENYPRVPWILLEEWPKSNFIKEFKLNVQPILTLAHSSPQDMLDSADLDEIVQKLLDSYYNEGLVETFKITNTQPTFPNIDRLLTFVLVECVPYYGRSGRYDDKFRSKIISEMIERISLVQTEVLHLFMKYPKNAVEGLERIILHADSEHRAASVLLDSFKKIKVKKIIEQYQGYTAKTITFQDANINFFNSILKALQIDDTLHLQDPKKITLFSNMLFSRFNIKDYFDFEDFLLKGEAKNEEYFERNIDILKQVVVVHQWIEELDNLHSNISESEETEKYRNAVIFMKRLLGRLEPGQEIVENAFQSFNFALIRGLIDSCTREANLEKLIKHFNHNFDFLLENLITGQKSQSYIQFQRMVRDLARLTPEQRRFAAGVLKIVDYLQDRIQHNQFYRSLVEQRSVDFPLLKYAIRYCKDQKYVNTIFDLKNNQKLANHEKRFLLTSLKEVLIVDDRSIQLVDRKKCGYFKGVLDITDEKLYKRNKFLFQLMDFSQNLYEGSQRENAPKKGHNGLLDPDVLLNDVLIQDYLDHLHNKDKILDYFLDFCRSELHELIFQREQFTIVLNVQKYKAYSKLPVIHEMFADKVFSLLDFIAQNYEKDFIEMDVSRFSEAQINALMSYSKSHSNEELNTLEMIRTGFYDSIVNECIKRGLSNLYEYCPKIVKVEDTLTSKQSKFSIPLLEIAGISKQKQFHNSELKQRLIKYFLSKTKSEKDAKEIRHLYEKMQVIVDDNKKNDRNMVTHISQILEKSQQRIFRAFLETLPLMSQVKDRSKIYYAFSWEFFNSFIEHNHRVSWQEHNYEYLQREMDKYQRVFLQYVVKPGEFKGQKSFLSKAIRKLENLLLNLQIHFIINEISEDLNIVYEKQYNYKMINNKIHLFLASVNSLYPNKVSWMDKYNFNFVNSVRLKLGHQGFLNIKIYFCKVFKAKPKVDSTLAQIKYKLEYYTSIQTISALYKKRIFNPVYYFDSFNNIIDRLAQINVLNTEIDVELCKRKYPLIPWLFLNLKERIFQKKYWFDLLSAMNAKHNMYLELLAYLSGDTDDDKADSLVLLKKFFELMHSELAADDLILRIKPLLPPECHKLIDTLTCYEIFIELHTPLASEISTLISSLRQASITFDRCSLLSILRIFALRGQYINRVEKINNKLRNILSDFDAQSLDIEHYLLNYSPSQHPGKAQVLQNSLIDILEILLNFKYTLFVNIATNQVRKLKETNFKRSFANFVEPNLKFQLLETIEPASIVKYMEYVLDLYKKDIPENPDLQIYNQTYEAMEFYHIAIFTSIRQQEKYQVVCKEKPKVKALIDPEQSRLKIYRNYLAHYSSYEKLKRKEQGIEEAVEMSQGHRLMQLRKNHRFIGSLITAWSS